MEIASIYVGGGLFIGAVQVTVLLFTRWINKR